MGGISILRNEDINTKSQRKLKTLIFTTKHEFIVNEADNVVELLPAHTPWHRQPRGEILRKGVSDGVLPDYHFKESSDVPFVRYPEILRETGAEGDVAADF